MMDPGKDHGVCDDEGHGVWPGMGPYPGHHDEMQPRLRLGRRLVATHGARPGRRVAGSVAAQAAWLPLALGAGRCGRLAAVAAHLIQVDEGEADVRAAVAIAARLANEMAGRFSVSSVLDVGTTFRLFLPRVPAGPDLPARTGTRGRPPLS